MQGASIAFNSSNFLSDLIHLSFLTLLLSSSLSRLIIWWKVFSFAFAMAIETNMEHSNLTNVNFDTSQCAKYRLIYWINLT